MISLLFFGLLISMVIAGILAAANEFDARLGTLACYLLSFMFVGGVFAIVLGFMGVL